MRVLAATAAVFVLCAQDQPVGKISGVVRDAATGQPIEGAPIFLNFQPQGRFTDQHGRYVLENIPEAPYLVAADEGREGRAVTVKGGTEAKLDLVVTRVASIEGTVVDVDGHPAKGATVAVLEKSYELGRSLYLPIATAVAGDDGGYRIHGITAGAPFLLLAGRPKSEAPQSTGGGLHPASTYYPHSPAAETGEEIVLMPGEVRSRIDIRGVALPVYCVSGVVRGAEKSAGVEITIRDLTGAAVRTAAKAGGEFQVCGLQRGTYRLSVLAEAAKTGGPRLGAGEVLAIDKADVSGLRLNLQEERQIPCQVVSAEGGGTSPRLVVSIVFRTPFGISAVAARIPGPPATGSIPEPFDDFEIMTIAGGDAYVRDIRAGEDSVLGRTVHPPIGALRVIAGSDGAKLNATAADADGNPMPYASIAVMPAAAGTVERFAELAKLSHADQNGAWTFGPLAPGRYLALATNDPLDTKACHIDKLWAPRHRAKEIELKPNATLQVKLNVQDLSGQ